MTDTLRKEFEATYRACFPIAAELQPNLFSFDLDDSEYVEAKVHIAFTLWLAARATAEQQDSVIEEILPADRRWVVSGAIAKVAGYRNCDAPRTKEVMQEFVDYMNAALADARDTAIELCAKEADDSAAQYAREARGGDNSGASDHKETAARDIASDIRALKSQQDAAISTTEKTS